MSSAGTSSWRRAINLVLAFQSSQGGDLPRVDSGSLLDVSTSRHDAPRSHQAVAAVVMSLVQSARMNGHDPWAYLRDVLERLPTHLNSRLDELLPHRWQPQGA